MNWFENQIKEREKFDEEGLKETYLRIASSVTGDNYYDAINDINILNKNAIDDIAHYFNVSSREIPQKIISIEDQIDYVMKPHGIMKRHVKLSGKWYKDAVGPYLALKNSDSCEKLEVVALIPDKFGKYKYYDRESASYVRVNSRNANKFSDEALTFYKSFPMEEMTIKEMFIYMFSLLNAGDYVKLVLAAFTATLLGLILPKASQFLLGVVAIQKELMPLYGMGIFVITVTIATMLINCIKELIVSGMATRVNISVAAATMMRTLSLPTEFFKNYSAGELADRLEYVNVLGESIVSTVISYGITAIFSIMYVFQIKNITPGLVGPSILVLTCTAIFSVILTFRQIGIRRKAMQTRAKESGMTFSILKGIQKIKLTGAENRMFNRWGRLYAKSAGYEYNPPLIIKMSGAIAVAISWIGTIVIYMSAINYKVTPEDYYAFNAAYGCVTAAFLQLTTIATTIANLKPVLEMVKPIFEAKPEVSPDRKSFVLQNGSIELDNVYFRYNADMPNVLDGITLKIRNGQYVAIVGKTGCGKSTLVRLLLGFEKAQKGAIYYGNTGQDINHIDLHDLRKEIGVVMQNGELFAGDIYSNIVISAPDATIDEAWEAARIAGVAEDIENMPMGMYTYMSEGNQGISGGQKQRLLIARAVAHKPKILILDEATSALDNITQKQVSDALETLKCTRIVIAHRLSTIKNCDRIIVLEQGKIVEDGTYDQLMNNNGFFKELVERQRVKS